MQHGLKDHEGMIENFIRILATDKEQEIYAGTFDGGVFRSGDGGSTWKPISRALPNDSIRGIVVIDDGLIVATGNGVFKTIDKGRQWMPFNKGLTNLSIQVMAGGGAGPLYVGTSSGVFRSDDGGESWRVVSYDHLAMGRPHYYSRMAVAPDDEDEAYFLTASYSKTIDGGFTLTVNGNAVATVVIAKWEGALDESKAAPLRAPARD